MRMYNDNDIDDGDDNRYDNDDKEASKLQHFA